MTQFHRAGILPDRSDRLLCEGQQRVVEAGRDLRLTPLSHETSQIEL